MTYGRILALGALALLPPSAPAAETALRAGVAKVEITDPQAKGPGDPLYVKALAVSDGETTAVLMTVDAVAIGEIGPIPNDYLRKVRSRLEKELRIQPANVMVNASHCHGIVCKDVDDRTVQAVKQAIAGMVPVKVGAGAGHEDRIMENRRLKLKCGREADVRHAYSLPPDEDLADSRPGRSGDRRPAARSAGRAAPWRWSISSPAIRSRGTAAAEHGRPRRLRLASDRRQSGRRDHRPVPPGLRRRHQPGRLQGRRAPRNAEPLGDMLGLSTLKAVRKIACRDEGRLRVINETVALPRADIPRASPRSRPSRPRLLDSLKGTSLNLKTFVPLYVKYQVAPEFPSADAHAYRHGESIGRDDLAKLDAANRADIEQYVANIRVMEELTRVRTNLALLKMHLAQTVAAGKPTIEIEVVGLRIGDFVLVTAPGELTVQTGLNIKRTIPARADLRLRLHQRLHLLHAHRRAAPQPGPRPGGLRHPGRPRMAGDLRGAGAGDPPEIVTAGSPARDRGEATNARAKTVTVLRTVIAKMSL